MNIVFAILAVLAVGFAIFVLMKNKKLEDDMLRVQSEAQASVAEAQKHITLGSDFDGLINPFSNIKTVEALPALKKYIATKFQLYVESLTDSSLWANQLDFKQFPEDLFFNNGFNFIKAFFRK